MEEPSPSLLPSPTLINLAIGSNLLWDGKALNILHIGEREITLRGEDKKLIVLQVEEIEALIQQGKIGILASQTEADAQNLRSLLGLEGDVAEQKKKSSSPNKGNVGKRKPKRDKIGVQQPDVS